MLQSSLSEGRGFLITFTTVVQYFFLKFCLSGEVIIQSFPCNPTNH
jgi:hypothetical protein